MTPAARLQAAIEILDEVIASARDDGLSRTKLSGSGKIVSSVNKKLESVSLDVAGLIRASGCYAQSC